MPANVEDERLAHWEIVILKTERFESPEKPSAHVNHLKIMAAPALILPQEDIQDTCHSTHLAAPTLLDPVALDTPEQHTNTTDVVDSV